ncbi:MAG: hypothetical protein KDA78_00375, partial [Planctomycetaceae bacterium]|nr:hypothetical protein [Planctomycetaceae bacterium]
MESIILPADLSPHLQGTLEWWYYNGHLTCGHRQFGFHVAVFLINTRRSGVFDMLPVPWVIPDWYLFAHASLTDCQSGKYSFALRRSLEALPAKSAGGYRVRVADCLIEGNEIRHDIGFSVQDARLELTLSPLKPVVLHGAEGMVKRDEKNLSGHFSYTRLNATGTIHRGNLAENVSGSAWLDREFDKPDYLKWIGGWEWFAIQLDDGRDIMIYLNRNREHEMLSTSSITIINADGTSAVFTSAEFSASVMKTWVSSHTEINYPLCWRFQIPLLDLELEIEPVISHQEMDTRGVSGLIYWEGTCHVQGRTG